MKDGICPKCGGDDVRAGRHWACRRSYLALAFRGNPARVVNYVCVTCGYLESYVEAADLERVARKWPRVEPKAVAPDPDGWAR